ncbi:MAG: hypothetical protein K2X93_16805 [Candidatus Obscuribacterales bacterium]|nr:hypothetical protein [Candidatus Obscuribacterales bacterium]
MVKKKGEPSVWLTKASADEYNETSKTVWAGKLVSDSPPVKCYRVNSPAVTFEWMDGEVIAVHLINGHYFSFVDTAAPVFCALASGASVVEIGMAIDVLPAGAASQNQYDLELDAWIARLVEEDLVKLDDSFSADSSCPEKDKWLSSVKACKSRHLSIEKFTDIEALLALDPVHDISSAGWPSRN